MPAGTSPSQEDKEKASPSKSRKYSGPPTRKLHEPAGALASHCGCAAGGVSLHQPGTHGERLRAAGQSNPTSSKSGYMKAERSSE